jgi:dihydrolipoamide dehydrogenase
MESDMAEAIYDVVVIGAGPGGYVAAIRAGQLGLKTACIDKEAKFGGTCLRIGCIPSKALLDASEKIYHARHGYAEMGIKFDNLQLDLPAMMARKDKIVNQLTGGVAFLLKKNKVDAFNGVAKFLTPTEIEVTAADGSKKKLQTKKVVIATGSAPIELPFMKFDGTRIISSDQAIALPAVPKRMVVVGAGAIGLELGSVWSRLGAQVTVLEMLPVILPGADEEIAGATEKVLKKQGLNFYTSAKVTGAKDIDGQLHVTFEWEGKQMQEAADVVLVAVGRKAYTASLGAAEVGVELDNRGRVITDGHFHTNVPNIFAIGDVIAGAMLAHKAEEEGIAVMEQIAGQAGHVNYDIIPGVVYTNPELAWVGQTEEQLKSKGVGYKVGKFRFAANGRAMCMDETEGYVKIIADAKTDRILGVHILGPQASVLIAEAAAVMEFGGSSEDIARTCHAHPTLAEVVKEAAMAVEKRAIHG